MIERFYFYEGKQIAMENNGKRRRMIMRICNIGKLLFGTFFIVLCSSFIFINQSEAVHKMPLIEQTPFEFNKQLVRYLKLHKDYFPTKLNHPPISRGKTRNGLHNVYSANFTKNNIEGEMVYLCNKEGDIDAILFYCPKEDIKKDILSDVVIMTSFALGLQKEEGDYLFKINKNKLIAKTYCTLLKRVICLKVGYDSKEDMAWYMIYAESVPDNLLKGSK